MNGGRGKGGQLKTQAIGGKQKRNQSEIDDDKRRLISR
jgi:hypothetical protein